MDPPEPPRGFRKGARLARNPFMGFRVDRLRRPTNDLPKGCEDLPNGRTAWCNFPQPNEMKVLTIWNENVSWWAGAPVLALLISLQTLPWALGQFSVGRPSLRLSFLHSFQVRQ